MKRVHSNPAGPVALNPDLKRHYLEPQYTLDTLPKDLIHFILNLLDFKSILSAQRTCKTLGPIVSDDLLWQDVLNRDFQGTPLVAPNEGALEEYKRQCRFVTNLIGGNFALRVFITKERGMGISTFAVTPDGRFITSGLGNTIKILDDPKTDHWVTLGKAENDYPCKLLLCDSKICVAVNSNRWIRAWNINTYESIPIPQALTGFSEDADPYQTTLVNGRLLQCTLNKRVIKVWDPESKDAAVLSFAFDHQVACATLYKETLLCSKQNGSVELCDMTKNARKVHQSIGIANQIYAMSETKYFISKERLPPEKTVTCVNYTDDSYAVSSLTLPTYPGISGNFTAEWHPKKSPRPCSLSELSSMFQAFSADAFSDHPPSIPKSEKIPYLSSWEERVGSCLRLAHNRGGLYQACHLQAPAGSAIFYADFTASNEEILLEIAHMYSSNKLTEIASKRLLRMPQSVVVAISRIYDKISAAKWSTSPRFWKEAILEYLNPGSNRDVLLALAHRFCDEHIEDATKELMSLPVSVREAIAKNYKRVSFVREETSALLWKHAVLEYLTPGSIIKETDILNKVIELLMSDDELEREYGANSFYKRVAPSTKEAIAKIQKVVATRPDCAEVSSTTILKAAVLEYLEDCNRLQSYGRTYQIIPT
jgi:hypothetical protein